MHCAQAHAHRVIIAASVMLTEQSPIHMDVDGAVTELGVRLLQEILYVLKDVFIYISLVTRYHGGES